MTKNIKFAVQGNPLMGIPEPAKKHIPEWYRDAERFVGGKLKITNGVGNHGLKTCVPFLDAMTSGYTALLPIDILVEQTDLGPKLQWRSSPDPLEKRPRINKTLPTPAGHDDDHYAWKSLFNIQVPKGYSILITHPFNRFDLPFTTLSGVVDADMTMARGNLPFFLKSGFEGIIPVGTPIYQIFPFKRENWKSENDDSITKIAIENEFDSMRRVYGWYKNFKWNRKSYE
jgi:hypothetical protein